MLDEAMLKESNSPLLDAFANVFGYDVVFNKDYKVHTTNDFAKQVFGVFNDSFFDPRVKDIDVLCLPYTSIVHELLSRGSKLEDIPKDFIGTYSVLMENEINSITPITKLEFHSEEILINTDAVDNKTFVFNAATICHEMIHHFDRLYGEYEDAIRKEYVTNFIIDTHTTPTFMRYMKLANDQHLKVISNYTTMNSNMLDYQTAQEMLKAITELDDPEAELAKVKAKHSTNEAKSRTIFGVTKDGKVSVNHFD